MKISRSLGVVGDRIFSIAFVFVIVVYVVAASITLVMSLDLYMNDQLHGVAFLSILVGLGLVPWFLLRIRGRKKT